MLRICPMRLGPHGFVLGICQDKIECSDSGGHTKLDVAANVGIDTVINLMIVLWWFLFSISIKYSLVLGILDLG
jgi:hypothetical protein